MLRHKLEALRKIFCLFISFLTQEKSSLSDIDSKFSKSKAKKQTVKKRLEALEKPKKKQFRIYPNNNS